MHLIHSHSKSGLARFYHNEATLTRQNTLPYFFRQMRVHRNLTSLSLAKKIGFSEDYVLRVESGVYPPSLEYCLKCGEEFGANSNWVKRKWYGETVSRFSRSLGHDLGFEN